MATYRIIFSDNSGSFAVDALAQGVGRWYGAVSNYDGDGHDMAFIELDSDADADYFEDVLESSDNVISYSVR